MRVPARAIVASVLLLGASAGCKDLTSPNFDFVDLDDLRDNPNRAVVVAAAQGLLVGTRQYYAVSANRLVGQLGILGRESYNIDPNDPRFESQMLRGEEMDPAAPAFGGNFWLEPYGNIRLGDLILKALDRVPDDPAAGGFTPQEKQWVQGFVKTINAVDFLAVVTTRDTNCGCPITVLDDPGELAPAVGKQEVFGHIVSLLDEAIGNLQAATGAPPFDLTGGFDGLPGSGAGAFKTAAGFTQFNRALMARVQVYIGSDFGGPANFNAALQALSQSFLDPAGDLRTGVYHVFTTGSGDLTNAYFQPGSDPNLRAHPSIRTDAQLKADGTTLDDRFVQKTREIQNRAFQGLCSGQSQFPVCDVGFDIYTSLTTPIPIIRNEELILLRAEANLGLGNLEAARADINLIRERAGGLPPVSFTSQAEALDQLLLEKRYSLLFEGGHRWIDMRRHGKLSELPLDLPGHVVHARFPLPIDEQLARRQ